MPGPSDLATIEAFIAAELRDRLTSFCDLDQSGEPIRDQIDPEHEEIVREAEAALAAAKRFRGRATPAVAEAIIKPLWLAAYDRGRFGVASKFGTYGEVVPPAIAQVLALVEGRP